MSKTKYIVWAPQDIDVDGIMRLVYGYGVDNCSLEQSRSAENNRRWLITVKVEAVDGKGKV